MRGSSKPIYREIGDVQIEVDVTLMGLVRTQDKLRKGREREGREGGREGERESERERGREVVELKMTVSHVAQRAPFAPKNDLENGRWSWRDVAGMAKYANTEPILVDADASKHTCSTVTYPFSSPSSSQPPR